MYQTKVKNFSLEQIMKSGQCFRMRQIDSDNYEIIAGSRYLKARQQEDQLTLYCGEEDQEFWLNYFDLDTDYGAYIDKLNPNDAYLMKAVSCGNGVRILRQDLWEMIVTFLVSQQNNIRRIRRCIDLLCRKYGTYIEAEENKAKASEIFLTSQRDIDIKDSSPWSEGYYTFPRPQAFAGLPEDALMECNLGYRSKYVVRSANQILRDEVSLSDIENLPYREARQELLKLFGVGEKVADCICLFARHDLDAFPVDTHIRQALDRHYKRGFPNRRYKGFRGLVQQYIFYFELTGNQI